MLEVVLVFADRLIWENPNGKNGQNEKPNNYTKDSHKLIFVSTKLSLFWEFMQTGNPGTGNEVKTH